ncbi:hypothetical protein BC830DRAFT_1175898 [Chytriomyces sp. MP71]|nr:hypothetical protein BC830DRAFT_1175898 [Chytriomyces sp. MP71]
MPGVSPRLAPLRESHVPTPSDSPEPEPVQDGIPEVQGDLDAESGDAHMCSSSATNGPNDEAPTEMVTTRHKEGFKWDTYMLPPPGMRPSVFTFGTSTPDPDIDSDSETDGSGHPPPQQRNVTPPSLPPIRTRSNSQVPTMQGRFSSLAPRSTTQSGAGTPRLRNTTSTGSRLAQPTTPAPTLSDAAPQPTTDLPNFRAVMDKIHGLGLEAPNKTIKPLTTFTSPQLRVRHFLRLEIVCHKPLPFGMGSGPIVLPEADRKKSLWRKAVPIGFRHRTCVEVPVVIHHADAVERKFLKSYLYGPQPLGVGQNGAPAV